MVKDSKPFTDKYREIIKILLQYSNLSNAEIAAQIGTDISHIRDFREEYKKEFDKDSDSVPWVDKYSKNSTDNDFSETLTVDAEPSATQDVDSDSRVIKNSSKRRRSITNRDELFELVQQIADIGGWEFEQQTGTVRWSEQLYRIHSLDDGSIETIDNAISYYHPADQKVVREALNSLLADEEAYDIEARIVRPDGEVRWVRIRGVPWYEDGTLVGAHGTLQDITDKKQREQQLVLFHEAVEQAGHGVVITNREGEIEYANQTYQRDTGYELSNLLGKSPRISSSGKHEEEFYEEMWETILAGDVWETEELINRRKSGELYHVDQTIAPITTDDGEITHFVGIESDITDLRLREQRLDVLNRILRHNLRNSITVIQGHLSEINSAVDSAGLQSQVEMVNDRIDQLTLISSKVSTLQSLFDRNFATDTAYNVTGTVDSLTAEYDSQYPDALITTTTPTEDVNVRCDGRIKVALEEAIENAIIHNDRESPEVAVDVFYPDDSGSRVTVQVADNGPGIPEQDQEAIEIGEETALTHASGIGLWITYWLVKAFGGDLNVSDNEPRGSIVKMTLPTSEHQPD